MISTAEAVHLKSSKLSACIFLPYSTNIKVEGLDWNIEDSIRGTFMTKASIVHGMTRRIDFAQYVYWNVVSMFRAMMRGENMRSKLQSYLPLPKMERNQTHLNLLYSYPEWLKYFKNTLRSNESIKGNPTYRSNMMKKEINLISFNLSVSSMG